MGRGYFRGFTAPEKTELWDRWQRGESLKAIGRAFGKPSPKADKTSALRASYRLIHHQRHRQPRLGIQ
jgi:transposase, IS30 family